MKLDPTETELAGNWIKKDGEVVRDAVAERIEWLVDNHLIHVAVSKQWGAWEALFQDPDDNRFWERTYPQGEMHGGGPSKLTVVNSDYAYSKYELNH